jgi:hypothetical protein
VRCRAGVLSVLHSAFNNIGLGVVPIHTAMRPDVCPSRNVMNNILVLDHGDPA